MSVIYLVHPTHGAKVAISNEEAIYDEDFGWVRYDIDAGVASASANQLASRPRGRPRRIPQED
jgi:hypothetical protein